MARRPSPWYWKARKAWYVTIDGKRHHLAENRGEANKRFHKLMSQPQVQAVQSDSVLAVIDLFLEWTSCNRSKRTYDWYLGFLQSFVTTIPPALRMDEIRPHHVQRWADSDPTHSDSTRRAKILTVKRAFNWARQQGYLNIDPLQHLQKPEVGRRDAVIEPDEFTELLEHCSDDQFRDLLTMAWETGARPQELIRVEARHFDHKNNRWVFPPGESKNRKKPRIIYLSQTAEEITICQVAAHPEGPLFRNSQGNPWTKDSIKCRFTRLTKSVGKNYCLYNFRHSFATRKLQEGLDPLTVAEFLGHSDPSMLAKVYQHLSHNPAHMLDQLRSTTG